MLMCNLVILKDGEIHNVTKLNLKKCDHLFCGAMGIEMWQKTHDTCSFGKYFLFAALQDWLKEARGHG